MLSSLTSKLRTLFGQNIEEPSLFTENRKRKRTSGYSSPDFDDDDDNDDVIIVSSKRPKLAPTDSTTGFFDRISPSAMADWVKRKKSTWNNSFFFRNVPHDKPVEQSSRSQGDVPPLVNGRVRILQHPSKGPLQTSVKTQTEFESEAESAASRVVMNGMDPHATYDPLDSPKNNRTSLFNSSCSKGRGFTVNQCVRLDERERYRQLLQHFTTVSLDKQEEQTPVKWPNSTIADSSHKLPTQPTLLGSYMPKDLLGTAKKKSTAYSKKAAPIKILHPKVTPPPRSPSPLQETKVVHSHKMRPEQTIVLDESIDVGIDVEEKKPWVQRDTTAHKFKESQLLTEDWINNLKSRYSATVRERQRKIAEEEIKTKIYKERRKEKEESLEKRIRQRMVLYEKEPAVLEEQVEEEEIQEKIPEFPALTEEMERVINSALRPHPADEVLSEGFKLQITRRDIATLSKLNWLNDEIINFYMNMLMARGELDNRPKVYAFNTFFCPKIMKEGHSSVRRWTRRVDIFSYNYLLIPVHLGMHWCLAVVDFGKKCITYYDSMGGNNMQCVNAIKKYLCDEMADKKKTTFNMEGWNMEIAQGVPQQMNGSDCGMFACKYAEYITRGAKITFSQGNMPYFRRRMVYEIITKKLL
ncbi:hypothetical protein ScPMuIL_016064 [Solemya velum]